MVQVLGALAGAGGRAGALVAQRTAGLDAIADSAARLPRRSRVYFEEWDEPMISGVGWVSELIRIADGEDCFPELAGAQAARYRVIADPAQAMAAQS